MRLLEYSGRREQCQLSVFLVRPEIGEKQRYKSDERIGD